MIGSKLRLAVVLAIATAAGPALAITRAETQRMSCAQVKGLLASEGAAVLRYPSTRTPGRALYDRYVHNRHACLMGQLTERRYVPAADTASCPVLRCYWPDPEERILIPLRP